jgi:DNA-binding LacI/PurR family transcriptional regulator
MGNSFLSFLGVTSQKIMPSIRDVARTAGVSIATVSRVINGAENVDPQLRHSVLQAVEACDYSPQVRRREADCVALIYLGPFTAGGPYDSACIEGMVEAMRESTFDLKLIDFHRDRAPGESFRQFFARKGLGAAVLRCTAAQRALAQEIAAERLPVVVLGDHFECEQLPFVFAESKSASLQAVEYLVSLGHQRIAFAACDRDDGDHLDRLEAYRTVLSAHNLLDERLICRLPPHRANGRQMLRNLVGMPNRATAIFIADPHLAVGAIIESHELGLRLPDDLSIIGFDDGAQANTIWPHMTAVCQDARALGRLAFTQAVQLAGDTLATEAASNHQSAWLDIGETTGPPSDAHPIMPKGGRLATR